MVFFDPGSWYVESEHPRGIGGKWTSKGGGDVATFNLVHRRHPAAHVPITNGISLTADENKALRLYQGNFKKQDGGAVNEYMRDPERIDKSAKINKGIAKIVEGYKQQIKSLNNILAKEKTAADVTLYRVLGGSFGPKVAKQGQDLVGKDLTASGFQSTSKIGNFDRRLDEFPVLMRIHVSKGTGAIDMNAHGRSEFSYQQEVLLGEGSYHVDSIEKTPGKKQMVLNVTYEEKIAVEHIKTTAALGHGYSKEAKLVDGVIHTSNVYDAVRALYEDRAVELNQPHEVSMLLDKLSAVAAEMVKLGSKAPNFNLCNITVKGTNLFCADAHGFPRVKMPQLDDVEGFKGYLKSKGYTFRDDVEEASYLRATQGELNGAKVAGIAKSFKTGGREPYQLVVSKDNYIVDGHHRWAAELGVEASHGEFFGQPVNVVRVDIGIIQLLNEANKFTGKAGRVDLAQVEVKNISHTQPNTLSKMNIKLGAAVKEDKALEPLQKAGFHAVKLEDAPNDLLDHLKAEPTLARPPTEISELHAISGKAFADATKELNGTVLQDVVSHLGDISFVYADYNPTDAAMTTVSGRGQSMFLINTACDYARQFQDSSHNVSFAAIRGSEIYKKTKDIRKATYESNKISAKHELIHMADIAMGGALTDTFVLALMSIPELKNGSTKTIAKWLQKNISPYALESSREATAEAASRFYTDGKLPGALNVWAQALLVSHDKTKQRKAA